MGDHETKNENENESEGRLANDRKFMNVEACIEHLLEWNQTLEKRVTALETELMSLRYSAEHGNDPRDEGWFD